jgi:predicted metal-dependent hydrolase
LLLLDLVIKGCWYNEPAENIFNEKAEEFLKTLFVKITVIAITSPKNRWGNIMNEETCS